MSLPKRLNVDWRKIVEAVLDSIWFYVLLGIVPGILLSGQAWRFFGW